MAREFSLSVVFQAVDRLTRPLRRMGQSLGRMSRPIQRLSRRLQRLGMTALRVGRTLGRIGKDLLLKLTLPIGLFGASIIRTATTFQAAMNFVRAVTNASEKDFKRLTNTAKELGRTTQFSATQAAEAMKFLGLAGLDVDKIIGALPRVLELAASAQLDLASAADIVTNVMFGLSIPTTRLAEVNDVLVNAFTKAKVDLLSLGQAFKKAGATLKAANVDFKTTTALLMGLGQIGRVGSEAGRGLARLAVELSKLKAASKKELKIMRQIGIDPGKLFDANGQLIDMVKILRLFGKTNIGLFEATELLGMFGGPTLLGLLESGADKIDDYRSKLDEVGIASRVAQSQMKGLPGTMKRLISVWEALKLAIVKSGLGTWVETNIGKLSDFIEKLAQVNPKLLATATAIAGIAAVIPLLIIGLSFMVKGYGILFISIGKLLSVFPLLSAAVGGFFLVLKAGILAHPIFAAIAALILGAELIIHNWDVVKGVFKKVIGLWEKWGEISAKIAEKIRQINWKGLFSGILQGIKSVFSFLFPGLTRLWGKWGEISAGIARGKTFPIKNMIQGEKSETSINLRVSSEKGTSAIIENVTKKGPVDVDISTVGFVGARP